MSCVHCHLQTNSDLREHADPMEVLVLHGNVLLNLGHKQISGPIIHLCHASWLMGIECWGSEDNLKGLVLQRSYFRITFTIFFSSWPRRQRVGKMIWRNLHK